MIYGNVEFHNIEEANVVEGGPGVRLQRVPESVRVQLNPKAQDRMLHPCGAEIRFVMEGATARVTLVSESATNVTVFHGSFESRVKSTIGEVPQTIEITIPARIAMIEPEQARCMAFSPRVVRLLLGGRGTDAPLHFIGIEGEGIRPPRRGEVPEVRYLAYGTSITEGGLVSSPELSWVSQVAQRLEVDALNLGSAASAFCEGAVADYTAARQDWDLATLEMSTNMIGKGFPLDEFYERVSYMVNTVAGADLSRPVACITIFPHFRDLGPKYTNPLDKGKAEQYRQALRDAVAACPHPNVRLVEGTDVLVDLTGLLADLVHPGDRGMIQMGENLARLLAPLVQECRNNRAARQDR